MQVQLQVQKREVSEFFLKFQQQVLGQLFGPRMEQFWGEDNIVHS
jgi:hypothetical protein